MSEARISPGRPQGARIPAPQARICRGRRRTAENTLERSEKAPQATRSRGRRRTADRQCIVEWSQGKRRRRRGSFRQSEGKHRAERRQESARAKRDSAFGRANISVSSDAKAMVVGEDPEAVVDGPSISPAQQSLLPSAARARSRDAIIRDPASHRVAHHRHEGIIANRNGMPGICRTLFH